MKRYLLKRLLLFPLTVFAILVINFLILNLAPGDPTEMMDGGMTGEAGRTESLKQQLLDDPYFQFREHFGLTLPIFFNRWPSISTDSLKKSLHAQEREEKMSVRHKLQLALGDRARFVLPKLYQIAADTTESASIRQKALNLFVRGGFRLGHLQASDALKAANKKIEADNRFLLSLHTAANESTESFNKKVAQAASWLEENSADFPQQLGWKKKISIFFTETRFCRYFSRLLHLDFGTTRHDSHKKVTHEVARRLKYSLTLSVVPLVISFAFAQFFGMVMALYKNRALDISLNTFFLILYAIPLFVFAPFIIEKVALGHTLPFTDIEMPISGFQSDGADFANLSSLQRLGDIALHLSLPLICLLYWMVAIQAKLARTTFLEILTQDYVRTAKAKGLFLKTILFKHVGRNAAITAVTAVASSLGIILSGSLIIETLFNIHGFGRFFYEAILNRDYNVILFSAIVGSTLSLVGYLVADIAYMILDPRIRIGNKS